MTVQGPITSALPSARSQTVTSWSGTASFRSRAETTASVLSVQRSTGTPSNLTSKVSPGLLVQSIMAAVGGGLD